RRVEREEVVVLPGSDDGVVPVDEEAGHRLAGVHRKRRSPGLPVAEIVDVDDERRRAPFLVEAEIEPLVLVVGAVLPSVAAGDRPEPPDCQLVGENLGIAGIGEPLAERAPAGAYRASGAAVSREDLDHAGERGYSVERPLRTAGDLDALDVLHGDLR